MSKETENIEATLNRYGSVLNKKITNVVNIIMLGIWLIVFAFITYLFGGIETVSDHFTLYISLLLSAALLQSLIIFGCRWVIPNKNVVTDIIEISGTIHKATETTEVDGRPVANGYYYFDLVSSNKEVKTILISNLQFRAVSYLVNNDEAGTVYKFKVAVIKASAVAILDDNLKNGTLALLPVEEYLPKLS